MSKPVISIVLIGALTFGVSACGDDDGASSKYQAFCDAELATEAATSADPADPAAIETAFTNLAAATPEQDKATVSALLEAAKVQLQSDGPPSSEFQAAYSKVIGIVEENCGFESLDVKAENYKFSGIDSELPAGATVVKLNNIANEFHEMIVLRKKDGITQSAAEILAMPQEESGAFVTSAGFVFAAPGTTGMGVIRLAPGDYIATCFVPTGLTEEAMAEMEASGTEPTGQPHFLNGMVQEFTVKA